MAIRTVSSFNDLNAVLRELYQFMDDQTTRNLDFHQRQIKNAHVSIDDYDYVVRKELHDLVGGAISQPARRTRGGGGVVATYDKATFGIGVGTECVVGNDLTPPYIWTNIHQGKLAMVSLACNVPPAGADLKINIRLTRLANNVLTSTAIFTSQPFLPDGADPRRDYYYTGIFDSSILLKRHDVLSIDCTQIGTSSAGQDVNVVLYCDLQ